MIQFKNKETGILWELVKVQSGGILCYCPQVNKKFLFDKKLFKKNFEEITISKLKEANTT